MNTSEMHIQMVVVFLVYGMAFFSMGLAMMLEARRSPILAEAPVLRPLAFFGLVHGSHEWFEMILLVNQWFGFNNPGWVVWVRLGVLSISFAALILFGLRVLPPQGKHLSAFKLAAGCGLVILYVLLVGIAYFHHSKDLAHWQVHADVLARYTLAVPGAGLAALALVWQARQASKSGQIGLSRALRLAAVGFGVYSLSQVVVAPLDIFPANLINTSVFLNLTGVPVQAVRAAMAGLVTIGMIRAAQYVEVVRETQLESARQARLQALQQVEQELIEREKMRKELLRHIVIAQEDERARIARELHDETAQFLTAFSLEVATLAITLDYKTEAGSILGRLQAACRRISEGIYNMVHDLRPLQLDDLGLVAALQYLVDDLSHRGLEVSFSIKGAKRRMDPTVEIAFFRVAQEALANVVRHAGVNQANLRLIFNPDQVALQVQDHGAGFIVSDPPAQGAWGLAGMRERAESVDGVLSIISSPGKGSLVELVVPVPQNKELDIKEALNEPNPLDVGR